MNRVSYQQTKANKASDSVLLYVVSLFPFSPAALGMRITEQSSRLLQCPAHLTHAVSLAVGYV